jgi:hypothetical protein
MAAAILEKASPHREEFWWTVISKVLHGHHDATSRGDAADPLTLVWKHAAKMLDLYSVCHLQPFDIGMPHPRDHQRPYEPRFEVSSSCGLAPL